MIQIYIKRQSKLMGQPILSEFGMEAVRYGFLMQVTPESETCEKKYLGERDRRW